MRRPIRKNWNGTSFWMVTGIRILGPVRLHLTIKFLEKFLVKFPFHFRIFIKIQMTILPLGIRGMLNENV